MSVKSRTLTTAVLGMGIAFGLLLQGATAYAQPDPATGRETASEAASDTNAAADADGGSDTGTGGDAAADTDTGTGGDVAADTDTDTGAGADADPVETPDPEQPVEPSDPEPADPEPPATDDDGEPAPDPSEEDPVTDGQEGASDDEPREPLVIAPLAAAASTSLSSGFKAGYIVSDANFYNGTAMTSAQIQTFLDQRLRSTSDGRCTIGDSGRKAGAAWGSTRIADKCLATKTWRTDSRAANNYCKAYAGRSNESAATIIAKVSKACSISPRVLLVMLEKEQSLVTDTWPTVRQFDVAMGYACPDSGPNNSANCDPSQTGFMQQVYRAAWQLQVYKANPASYNYKPFQTNTIQWHPNAGCGTSRVYIENWATAALYIYTPYRPNQAALDAGWGTGNSCSSYGNRNFYQFYKQWFGSPNSTFPDVPQGHQFYTEIEWMAATKLTTGITTSDGRRIYSPKGTVTREAMAAFLYRLNGSPAVDTSKAPFADMRPGDKFYKEIVWMYNSGLSTGISQGSGKKPIYAPKDRVSREAMAAFIYRYKAAKYTGPATSPFADMKRGDKFYDEITWMRKEGLSTGIAQPSGKPIYAPKDRVSREAMAAFIYRLSN
ncbi:S-layer homology domain-containing protein [Leucobacter sp.]